MPWLCHWARYLCSEPKQLPCDRAACFLCHRPRLCHTCHAHTQYSDAWYYEHEYRTTFLLNNSKYIKIVITLVLHILLYIYVIIYILHILYSEMILTNSLTLCCSTVHSSGRGCIVFSVKQLIIISCSCTAKCLGHVRSSFS